MISSGSTLGGQNLESHKRIASAAATVHSLDNWSRRQNLKISRSIFERIGGCSAVVPVATGIFGEPKPNKEK